MSPRVVRWAVVVVCAAGIAGMVSGSIADDNTVTLTFGLVTAAAVACLIVATAVAGGGSGDAAEAAGLRVEELVQAMVARGADETALRDLVREAVALGRSGPSTELPGSTTQKARAGVHGGRTPRPGTAPSHEPRGTSTQPPLS